MTPPPTRRNPEGQHSTILFLLERQVLRERVGEVVCEKMFYIVEAMSRHDYMPKIPNQSELENVFDITLPDVQPYLHRVFSQTGI